MTRLIGFRCKHSNVLSREVLIARFLLGNLEITNSVLLNGINIILISYLVPACHDEAFAKSGKRFKDPHIFFENYVLVICREGHTRSHSEHGS